MSPCGFTLVEMLITTTLMTFVAGAIVAALTGGIRVWQRASSYRVDRQAALITFDQLRKDLHNHRAFTLVPFDGAYDAVAWPTVGRLAADPEAPMEIGRVGYYFDTRRHTLCRAFTPYRLMRHVDLRDRCDVVLEDVQQVRFEYFGGPEGQADWAGSWRKEAALPSAVKISVMTGPDRQHATTHNALIYLGATGQTDDAS